MSGEPAQTDERIGPFNVFNFLVEFGEVSLPDGAPSGDGGMRLCAGAFSEITGLEATMEPKVIKEGGRNYGPVQRVGPVTFATVVLKRGISTIDDLWKWFDLINGGAYAKRLTATVIMRNMRGERKYAWRLHRCLPTKFKHADFNATATAVGIEELHLAHEGLERIA
jgi:phage tail-like protein